MQSVAMPVSRTPEETRHGCSAAATMMGEEMDEWAYELTRKD
jgi:hypothetical protein